MAAQKTTLNDVLAALKAHDWKQIAPGRFVPSDNLELPTPENIPKSWWGGETYLNLRAVNISPISSTVARYWVSTGNPWVGARKSKASAKEVLEFIQETTRMCAEAREETSR